MVWRGIDLGVFFVQSAYHLAKEIEGRSSLECSRRVEGSDIWQVMWKLQIPNADKNFLWRVCHNILPTRDNLLKRKIIQDPRCPIYGIEVETATHILWSCPSASYVWSVREIFFQKYNFVNGDFLPLVEEIYEKGGKEMLTVFTQQAKSIWMRRHGVIHGDLFIDPNELDQATT
jgi:hypothetical protein